MECIRQLTGHTNGIYALTECIRQLTGHTNGIYALTASPDNRTLISGGIDTTVRI